MPTTPGVITFIDALARIAPVVAARPDYVNAVPQINPESGQPIPGSYKTCQYVNEDGSPSCVVGCAFATEINRAGITYTSFSNQIPVTALFHEALDLRMTRKATDFLREVQTAQDTGATWAEALQKGLDSVAPYDENGSHRPGVI